MEVYDALDPDLTSIDREGSDVQSGNTVIMPILLFDPNMMMRRCTLGLLETSILPWEPDWDRTARCAPCRSAPPIPPRHRAKYGVGILPSAVTTIESAFFTGPTCRRRRGEADAETHRPNELSISMRPDKPQPRRACHEASRKLVAGASRALPPVQVAVLPASRLTCGIICGWLDCT
jgi:hypothetical protein